MGERTGSPHDPGRKDRILDSALNVIASCGVHGATHRKIAQDCGVSPGSLTYYFEGFDDIVAQAFDRLSQVMSKRFDDMLSVATTRDEACEIVVSVICDEAYADRRDIALLSEMYAYAVHHPNTRATHRRWLVRSNRALREHFSADASEALDALIEGWPIQRENRTEPPPREVVRRAVRAIADLD